MKATYLKIKNIGLIADVTIQLDKPLILFYGEIRQGKTTILKAVRWAFGGSFPQDIIRHGEKEAFVELGFSGGLVRREWYRAKNGDTKARDIDFVIGGRPAKEPVTELKKFLNPFLLDQDHLLRMGETDRKKFFTDLFAVDTTALDTEAYNLDREASTLRVEIKAYGAIDTTPVQKPDAMALKDKLKAIKDGHAEKVKGWRHEIEKLNTAHREKAGQANKDNEAIAGHNATVTSKQNKLGDTESFILSLKAQLKDAEASRDALKKWLAENPKKESAAIPPAPDTSELQAKIDAQPDTADLERQISDAGAAQVRYEQYEANLNRAKEKQAKETALSEKETRLRAIKVEKASKLKTVTDTCGIPGLAFDDTGAIVYEGTTAGMLSTSQIMRLSSQLSAMYPEGFGLELLDRGESLGKSIFLFVEQAKREEKTILATIVGEKPAAVPENIGVFVVEQGAVKAAPATEGGAK